GGAADAEDNDLPISVLVARLDELEADFYQGEAPAGAGRGFDHPRTDELLARARELADRIEGQPDARAAFVCPARAPSTRDNEGKFRTEGAEDGPFERKGADFLEIDRRDVLELLRPAPAIPAAPVGDEGGASGLGDAIEGGVTWMFNGVRAA